MIFWGVGSPVEVPLNLQMSKTRIQIWLLRMHFPLKREFGSALSTLRNFTGWFEPPPPVRHCLLFQKNLEWHPAI
jgi:hypothetical protein